jgi:hypothetical protein
MNCNEEKICKTDMTMMGGRGERENLNYSSAVHVSQSIRNESTILFWWVSKDLMAALLFFITQLKSEKRKTNS